MEMPPQDQLASLATTTNKVRTDGKTPFNGLVNFLGFNTILLNATGVNSHYNSLQAEVHGRVTRDLQLQAAYTYSQAIDPTTGNLGGGDSFDLDHVSNPYDGWRHDSRPSPIAPRHIAYDHLSSDTAYHDSH